MFYILQNLKQKSLRVHLDIIIGNNPLDIKLQRLDDIDLNIFITP